MPKPKYYQGGPWERPPAPTVASLMNDQSIFQAGIEAIVSRRFEEEERKKRAKQCCNPDKDVCNRFCCDAVQCGSNLCDCSVSCCKRMSWLFVWAIMAAIIVGVAYYAVYGISWGIDKGKDAASSLHSWAGNKASYFSSSPSPVKQHPLRDTAGDDMETLEWLAGNGGKKNVR